METQKANGVFIEDDATDKMPDEPDTDVVVEHKVTADFWKWVAACLFALVMFMLGGVINHLLTNSMIQEHQKLAGHPLMEERVQNLERMMEMRLGSIETSLSRIEEKMDD